MNSSPRILLISQWPNVKNGEYELIEKIRQTGFSITVVDFLGFDVSTGECLNTSDLSLKYDFAISFHYDTPKFLNIMTYLWVANPLEFMHLRGDYRNVLFPQLRSYDDYLFNGSNNLKSHISDILGEEFVDSDLALYPSCSSKAMVAPSNDMNGAIESFKKIFYCGVNWERGIDRKGRAQGLLEILQDKKAADFYGPEKLDGISPWEGYSSYKGEIPFDGVSMIETMSRYGAVLAVSSPAHMKSKTSSSRVFEGVSAGVPVISDENEHVKKLFGDSVYYFVGNSEEERAKSILETLENIKNNPQQAKDKVLKAQALMREKYCFEPCFERIASHKNSTTNIDLIEKKKFEIFVIPHNPEDSMNVCGNNLDHVIRAAEHLNELYGMSVRINIFSENILRSAKYKKNIHPEIEITKFDKDIKWAQLKLGEKIGMLSSSIDGDFCVFLTQFDYPMYDAFSKGIDWFEKNTKNDVFISGHFVDSLERKAPASAVDIHKNLSTESMYRWTQNSLAEHEISTLIFRKSAAKKLLAFKRIQRLDAVLPVSIIADCYANDLATHRSRHILVRVQASHFVRHYSSYQQAIQKGFWAQHYNLITNYNHELNALYDIHHASKIACDIVDKVSGHALTSMPPIDPAVHTVNNFVSRLRPIYRRYKRVRQLFKI